MPQQSEGLEIKDLLEKWKRTKKAANPSRGTKKKGKERMFFFHDVNAFLGLLFSRCYLL